MPSFPPRTETVKKQNQLSQKESELRHTIRNNASEEKLINAAEKYKAAKLSLIKANLHMIREKELRGIVRKKSHNYNVSRVEAEKEIWTNKTVEEILHEFNE